jgi:hypothetical protein
MITWNTYAMYSVYPEADVRGHEHSPPDEQQRERLVGQDPRHRHRDEDQGQGQSHRDPSHLNEPLGVLAAPLFAIDY